MSTIQEKLAARAAEALARNGSQNDVEKGGEGKKVFKLAPAGKVKARLVGYIETGIHANNMDAAKPDRAEFRLRFALFGPECQEEDGSPITIEPFDLPISKFERAGAVKLFQKMCPKKDADNFIGLIGRVFWLTIAHKEGKADAQGNKKVYANIVKDSINVAVKDVMDENDNVIGTAPVACPEAPEDIYHIFEWDVPSKEDFDSLKSWDKSRIRAAKNFQGSALQQLVGDGEKSGDEGNGGAGTQEPPADDTPEAPVETTPAPADIQVNADDLPAL